MDNSLNLKIVNRIFEYLDGFKAATISFIFYKILCTVVILMKIHKLIHYKPPDPLVKTNGVRAKTSLKN